MIIRSYHLSSIQLYIVGSNTRTVIKRPVSWVGPFHLRKRSCPSLVQLTGNEYPPTEPYVRVSLHTALHVRYGKVGFERFFRLSPSYVPLCILWWQFTQTGICFLLSLDINCVNPLTFWFDFLICLTWCISMFSDVPQIRHGSQKLVWVINFQFRELGQDQTPWIPCFCYLAGIFGLGFWRMSVLR